MDVTMREMFIEDYENVIKLWKHADGIGLSEADSRENISVFLARNPGLSVVAEIDGAIIGAVLCGHDGRRGYLHHLAVSEEKRLKGIGKGLVERCFDNLKQFGITRCHIFVFRRNQTARDFWLKMGWQQRDDLDIMSKGAQ